MEQRKPLPDIPYVLRFRDSVGEYDAGPFYYENERWVRRGKYEIEAQGNIVRWTPELTRVSA